MQHSHLRCLPTMAVLLVIVIVLFLTDRAQVQSLVAQKHVAADSILHDVQAQFDRFVSRSIRSTRGLATKIDPAMTMDQQAFETLIDDTVIEAVKLQRVELAPGFVTSLVYPQDGNQSLIGKSPLSGSGDDVQALIGQAARRFPVLSRIIMDNEGRGELETQSEFRRAEGDQILSVGMIRVVTSFALSLTDPSGTLESSDLEFLSLARPAGSPEPVIPADWQKTGKFAPHSQIMRYPPGDFHLFLRPKDGWQVTFAEMAPYRLKYGGLALLLLLPIFLANRFAVSNDAARQSLARMETDLEGVLQNLPGAAMSITIPAGNSEPGPDDAIRFLNPDSSERIWGLPAKTVEADPTVFWSSMHSPDDVERLLEAVKNSHRSLEPVNEIWAITTDDGEKKWLLGHGIPTRKPDGSVQWAVLIFDTTDQVKHEAELNDQRELAFQAQKNQSIGHLTGGVAHDFNNLLAVVLGNLELLEMRKHDRESLEYIDAAIKAVKRGSDLTRSMLAFAGQARLSPVTLNLNEVLNESRRWIERVLPESVEMRFALNESLGATSVDRSSLESAILNLILNARDAMEGRGELTIKTENVQISADAPPIHGETLAPGSYVQLSISDTGHGVAEADQERVFDPFFTTKGRDKGTGLGLSMVLGFMQQTGGAVRMESSPENGSTFVLLFPREDAHLSKEQPPAKATSDAALRNLRVLVVDDDEAVLDILVRMLAATGIEVVPANSGDEALSLFTDNPNFDLLLTDVVMPGKLQGPELASRVKAQNPDLPVILLSGFSDPVADDQRREDQEFMRLMKPLERSALLAAVKTVAAAPDHAAQQ